MYELVECSKMNFTIVYCVIDDAPLPFYMNRWFNARKVLRTGEFT